MLLAMPPLAEYPGEALLARLRARRAALDLQGGESGGPSPEAFMAWLHPRLDARLRAALEPYLELEAMRCLLLALRHRLGGESAPPTLLRQPWLAAEPAALLERPGDSREVAARLERWLAADYPFAAGLERRYLAQGPGAVEQQLAAGMLVQALAAAHAPVVRMTVSFLIDLRNLLAVLRHWRWRLRQAPALVAGGEIGIAPLGRAWAGEDAAAVRRLAAGLGGGELAVLEPRDAERRLLGILTVRLRRAGRDPLDVGVVMDALWRCRVAARNRALRLAAGDEDGLLAAALL